ncbi:MAG: rRNA maturation RNAse YbeY [Patescibacteria group bacterium]
MTFALRNLTKQATPRIPFERMARRALGTNYDLSVVLVGNSRSRTLNRHYRGKDKAANVLSFPIDRHTGELFLNLGRRSTRRLAFLFIHGLLHLKGLDHGSKMESLESQLVNYFQINEPHDRRRVGRGKRVRSRRRL